MAVTGTGTEQDPFVVHSYDEFMTLNNHAPIGSTRAVYIKWFDTPGQILNCNDYGSEFKWGSFAAISGYGGYTIYVDLNGATIKNLIVADGATMFVGTSWGGEAMNVCVQNGSIRNVFMGSSTSKICGTNVIFKDVSMSANVAGSTVIPFHSDWSGLLTIDNCAIYLVASTLTAPLFCQGRITDTDFELHISDQNSQPIFIGDNNATEPWTTLKDCRIQGKISGKGMPTGVNADTCVLDYCGLNSKSLWFTNCVIDLDLTDSRIVNYGYGGSRYDVFLNYNGANFNTNVICKSHRPNDPDHEAYYGYQSDLNFMTHEQIRDGDHLNDQGFIVVEVNTGG